MAIICSLCKSGQTACIICVVDFADVEVEVLLRSSSPSVTVIGDSEQSHTGSKAQKYGLVAKTVM